MLLPGFAFSLSSKEVKIEGHLQSSEPVKMIYLRYNTTKGQIVDSARLFNGNFSFEEKLEEPAMAILNIRFAGKNNEDGRFGRMELFLEPGKMEIEIADSLKSLKFVKVNGSKAHTEFIRFNELKKPFEEKIKELINNVMAYSKDQNEAGIKQEEKKMDQIDKEMKEQVHRSYLLKNPGSVIAMAVLKQYVEFGLDFKKTETLFLSLRSSVRQLPSAIAFEKRLEMEKKNQVGLYAMDFTQNDTSGRPVSLSSFKGKYVLLDFWASWCMPCRADNPNIVKTFQAFKDKGFTVLSVSLDQKRQSWLDAIHKDELAWTHVSDLKYWSNAVAKQYGIQSIPQNLLIDPKGVIIARNLHGDEFEKELEKYIK
jgi:peroxiredoxin